MKRLRIDIPDKSCIAPDVRQVSEIIPFLWIGSKYNAFDKELVFGKKIIPDKVALIINVTKKLDNKFADYVNYYRIPIDDNGQEQMTEYFDPICNYIDRMRKQKKHVLVHCHMGISRSPTLVIAYIMCHLNLTIKDAFQIVKETRPFIDPNMNFVLQLQDYEKRLQAL